MPSSYSSDSDESFQNPKRLSGHIRPMHEILGRGKVADILLWKNKNLSAAILIGFTIIWFPLEVLDYNFITLLCQTTIFMMLILFIWSIGAQFLEMSPPYTNAITIPESTFKWVFAKINWSLQKLCYISSGKDLRTFFMAIAFLWVLSSIGNYFSSLNILYIGFLCLATLPAMYDRYRYEVDHLVREGKRDVKKLYKKVDSKFLNKIPRETVKKEMKRF